MRNITNISVFPLLLLSVLFVFAVSCGKDDDDNPSDGKTSAVFNPAVTYGTMTDLDSNVYRTVTIGTQTWMAENLRTTKYNDGTPIPEVTGDDEWIALTTGAYCNFKNTTNAGTIATYGRLYNGYALDRLAPAGWHIPTFDEWLILINYLGGEELAGGKLKEAGTEHWQSINVGATNETGFTALPGGSRSSTGAFCDFKSLGRWWCAPFYNSNSLAFLAIFFNHSGFYGYSESKKPGFSVRCVKD